jgi:hypothetical protein
VRPRSTSLGSTCSTKRFSSSTSRSPAADRMAVKKATASGGQSSHESMVATNASM